jgi:hypothetical protein
MVILSVFFFFDNVFLAAVRFDISASVRFVVTFTLAMLGDEICGLELG